jgi:hypothetical protein
VITEIQVSLPPSLNYRNVLALDLLDAQLSGDSLSQPNPAPGILSVNVDRRDASSVILTMISTEQLPNVNVEARDPGVVANFLIPCLHRILRLWRLSRIPPQLLKCRMTPIFYD